MDTFYDGGDNDLSSLEQAFMLKFPFIISAYWLLTTLPTMDLLNNICRVMLINNIVLKQGTHCNTKEVGQQANAHMILWFPNHLKGLWPFKQHKAIVFHVYLPCEFELYCLRTLNIQGINKDSAMLTLNWKLKHPS